MSNARRPTTARKVTTKTEDNRRAELDHGVALTLDGETYTLRVGDMTPNLAREVRKVIGRSFRSLIDDLSSDPDIDVIAEAIWVARHMKGDKVDLDTIVLDYDLIDSDAFDIALAGSSAGEDDGSPEA